jgi:hypothetical protein
MGGEGTPGNDKEIANKEERTRLSPPHYLLETNPLAVLSHIHPNHRRNPRKAP